MNWKDVGTVAAGIASLVLMWSVAKAEALPAGLTEKQQAAILQAREENVSESLRRDAEVQENLKQTVRAMHVKAYYEGCYAATSDARYCNALSAAEAYRVGLVKVGS